MCLLSSQVQHPRSCTLGTNESRPLQHWPVDNMAAAYQVTADQASDQRTHQGWC